jgi:hypothetical protein
MNRYKSINEALNKKIEIYSELEPGKTYSIEGTPHKYIGPENDSFVFQAEGSDDTVTYSREDLERYMAAGEVTIGSATEFQETVPDFPNLDRFTRNTFSAPTKDLWEAARINTEDSPITSTDLYTLDQLVRDRELDVMPMPEETRYEELLNSEHWPILKKYLQQIEPDIELPEELG